jgi:hypothetical protein
MEIITEEDLIFNTIANRDRTLKLYEENKSMFPYKVNIRETRAVKLPPYEYKGIDPRTLIPMDCLIIYKDDDVYTGVINLLHIGEGHLSAVMVHDEPEFSIRKIEYNITLMSSISQKVLDVIPELSRVVMNRMINSNLIKIMDDYQNSKK